MNRLVDLHLHSHHSDGTLAPGAVVELAASRGVDALALTDHDTLAGCAEARASCQQAGLRFLAGVEMSASWRGRAIHVLGIEVDEAAPQLHAALRGLRARRCERIQAIGERLTRRGRLPGHELAAEIIASAPVPTRMHFARLLVARDFSPDVQAAFDRWLGRNTPGEVPIEWPDLAPTLAVLAAAKARIVLAHPHRYRLSAGALRQLIDEFRSLGGEAIEVSIAGMGRRDADRLAGLARRFALAGSSGSDFHDPAVPWHLPGRFAKLPADLEHIGSRLGC